VCSSCLPLFISLPEPDVRHERTQVGLGGSLVREELTEGDVWSRTGAAHADALDMLLSGQERLIEVRLRGVDERRQKGALVFCEVGQ